jgi:hypothetical protein
MLVRVLAVAAVIVLTTAGSLTAQVYRGALWGRVTDSTGGVLPRVGTNIDDGLRAQGAGAGTPTKYIASYNLEGGGPVVADKAWVWGGFGVQDIHRGVIGFLKPGCEDADDVNCLHDEAVLLSHINVKLSVQLTRANTFSFLFSRNEKIFPNRGAGVRNPSPETTTRQRGPGYLYKFEDTHVVSPSFLLTGRFAYHDVDVHFDYQDPSLLLFRRRNPCPKSGEPRRPHGNSLLSDGK